MAKTRGTKSIATAAQNKQKVPPKFPRSVAGAVRAALDKKAIEVVVLDLRKAAGFTDFFVICTGASPRQVNAIADGVEETLRTEFSERPHMAEGTEKSQWILLDYFNFVVHVFSRECRAFYELERLWGSAGHYAFSDESSGETSEDASGQASGKA
jgi:ribosome-associated protein